MKINWRPQYEPWDAPKPSDEEWRTAYERWMYITENRLSPLEGKIWMFGLVNPETREFGLITYIYDEFPTLRLVRGAAGVESVLEYDFVPDQIRHVMETPVINAEWVERKNVFDEEAQRLRALGLEFSEQGKWPHFHAMRPGFARHSPTAQELRFLSLALQKLIELAPKLDEATGKINTFLLQFPTLLPPRKKGGEWKLVPDLQLDLPPQKFAASGRLLRKAGALPQGPESFTVYLGWMGGVELTEENIPPVVPYFLLTVESVFGEEIRVTLLLPELSLEDVYRRVSDTLLDHLLDIGRRPAVLHTTQQEIADILASMEKPLGVRVNLGDPPPVLDMVIKRARAALQSELEKQ